MKNDEPEITLAAQVMIQARYDAQPLEHKSTANPSNQTVVAIVVLLFYIHGKHLRSCRDGQLT